MYPRQSELHVTVMRERLNDFWVSGLTYSLSTAAEKKHTAGRWEAISSKDANPALVTRILSLVIGPPGRRFCTALMALDAAAFLAAVSFTSLALEALPFNFEMLAFGAGAAEEVDALADARVFFIADRG
jgi:hypothetical protein